LRRVSIGRREFAAAGAWVRGARHRRGSTAPRTATGEGLFAARERASGAPSRAALRATEASPTVAPTMAAPVATTERAAAASRPPATPVAPKPTPAPGPAPAQPATPAPVADASSDTMARLRDAKRRARER
jgi:hypothetical protein